MTGNNTLEQINKRGDKVIGIFKMTVAPAGKLLNAATTTNWTTRPPASR
jgi:hypothetical protein